MKNIIFTALGLSFAAGCLGAEASPDPGTATAESQISSPAATAVTTSVGPDGQLVTTAPKLPSSGTGAVTPNALQACSIVTGPFITGTNTNGGLNFTSVTCPAGQIAVTADATWQLWFGSSACIPVVRRAGLSTVLVDWFSSPAGVGTGCQGNSLAAMTLCCVP